MKQKMITNKKQKTKKQTRKTDYLNDILEGFLSPEGIGEMMDSEEAASFLHFMGFEDVPTMHLGMYFGRNGFSSELREIPKEKQKDLPYTSIKYWNVNIIELSDYELEKRRKIYNKNKPPVVRKRTHSDFAGITGWTFYDQIDWSEIAADGYYVSEGMSINPNGTWSH